MSVSISSTCGKMKKSKLEKIFELQADLKIKSEENELLQTEIASLKKGQEEALDPNSLVDNNEVAKMKLAFQALKKVAITQEKEMHSLRTEVLRRRKQQEDTEVVIESLRSEISALEDSQNAIAASTSADEALKKQVVKLQKSFFREKGKTATLQQEVREKSKALESLQSRLDKASHRRDSERSLLSRRSSMGSVASKTSIPRSLNSWESDRSMMNESLTSNRTSPPQRRSRKTPSERSIDLVSVESGTSNTGIDASAGRSRKGLKEAIELEVELGEKIHRISRLENEVLRLNETMARMKTTAPHFSRKEIAWNGMASSTSMGEVTYLNDSDQSDDSFW